MAAEFAAGEEQFNDALQAELHRWDAYLNRMQAKAAAKSGAERERAEAAIADLRQLRVSIGKSSPTSARRRATTGAALRHGSWPSWTT